MTRYGSDDQENNSRYGQFFQPSSGTIERQLTNAEIARAEREAIEQAENYQEKIRIRQERKAKIEQLLNKGNLSVTVRENALIKVQSLEAELKYHQTKLATLIESDASLQAHFASHP